MTLTELEDALMDNISGIIPNFSISVDERGEVVIYTGLIEDSAGELVDAENYDSDIDFGSDEEENEDY
jgi:hypothetical protein